LTAALRSRAGRRRTGEQTIEERRVEIVRLRKRVLFGVIGALAAATVILPAVAGSETSPSATIEAVNGIYYEEHHWSPSQVTVSAGGVVTISNLSMVKHGVEWRTGPATPTCSSGIPIGMTEAASATNWSGTCTFTTPGTYTFYCTVHHAAMTGTITVNADTTPSPTSPQAPTPTGGSTTTGPSASNESGSRAMLGSGGVLGSPLAGGASSAVRLPAVQHGKSVHGSVAVSQAGAGGGLEVDLLAKRASLATVSHGPAVRVGRFVRSSLRAGTVSFTVPLNATAKGALRRHRRLALTAKVALKPTSAAAVTVTRGVLMHP
jgi:plastocyanin